jgi:ubiquinone/menaquinone biosynthesis C-methylase UbiE
MDTKLFYRLMAGLYDLLDVVYFRNRERSPRTAVCAAVGAEDRILDLCTGTAESAVRIAGQRPAAQITGVDLSDDMLRIAREKVERAQIKTIQLCRMDATKLAFEDGSFDKVLISLVLHEVEEPLADRILLEARRVLKDDGEILVTEWEPPDRRLLQKFLFLPIQALEPKCYRAFVRKDLSRYFAGLGLPVAELIHCDYTRVLRLRKADRQA